MPCPGVHSPIHHAVNVPGFTGSVGIGLQVAKALALNGARVIIAGRSETRCAEYALLGGQSRCVAEQCMSPGLLGRSK